MDSPRASSRPSRRSYPNLSNLSLAPLSSNYPLDASQPPSQPPSPSEPQIAAPQTSYIAQKSAPTTPGILSLSHSRSNSRNGRRRRPKAFAHDSYFANDAPAREIGDIPKSKSTGGLHPGVSHPGVSFVDEPPPRHHTRKRTAPNPLRLPLVRHHTSESTDEWFHRAGLAIAGETRESKGQSWLIRRESSTSLVNELDGYEQHPSHDKSRMALLSGEHLADVEYSVFTPRLSRAGSRIHSRVGSRVHSARNSRRGSRVGSRADLIMSGMPQSDRYSLELEQSMFDGDTIEPDFVEADGESDGDEEEVARLAKERGFGLGNWMDRLIGWTLFSVDEDAEESDEEDEDEDEEDEPFRPENMTREELKLHREAEAKRRKMEREAIIAASAVHSHVNKDANSATPGEASGDEQKPPTDQDSGGWQDAAWLLSVASKVLF
ncbi:hypothetical protein P154DRAFT_518868 [Amniculicola lignicola CBS 123094]|uniref:Uncharacterized protein n=1 Tax=Amniculicola lignicola CBS 123094 TaxID=1392246 RepID=A0A6A5WV11_9PLEO|nr:hypothetical protein P154DRAFT_518868 [Amniculicola lignicola CBS 123094]